MLKHSISHWVRTFKRNAMHRNMLSLQSWLETTLPAAKNAFLVHCWGLWPQLARHHFKPFAYSRNQAALDYPLFHSCFKLVYMCTYKPYRQQACMHAVSFWHNGQTADTLTNLLGRVRSGQRQPTFCCQKGCNQSLDDRHPMQCQLVWCCICLRRAGKLATGSTHS